MLEAFSSLTAMILAFILGTKHALEADHLAAIGTLAVRIRKRSYAALLGAAWALGHSAVLFVLAGLMLFFKMMLPVSLILYFELAVGIMLVLLGVNLLYSIFCKEGFANTTCRHVCDGNRHLSRSFLIGTLHGLAGSGILVILVAATASNVLETLVYLLLFGIGLMLSMALMSMLLSAALLAFSNTKRLYFSLLTLSGLVSMVLGVVIVGRLLF
jgi:high-affinity nickel permease